MVLPTNIVIMEIQTETPNNVRTKRNQAREEQYWKEYLNTNSTMVM